MTMITDAPADTTTDTSATDATVDTTASTTDTTAETGTEAKTPEQVAADEAAAAAAAGAPEKYEDFTAPEGAALDPAVMTDFAEAARELNMSQENAQKMITKMAPVMAKQQAAQIEALDAEWTAASKADKEFGGAALAENLVHAKRAMDKLGTPELRTILNGTKMGNNPEMVRFMVRAGKLLGEDSVLTGGNQATATKRSPADILYPEAKK